MPTYEYECSQCGYTFELFQSMKDDPVKDCPAEGGCGAKGTVRRLIGAGAGVIFKGSGFYQTDYKKSPAAATCPAAKESKSSDAPKPDCSKCCSGGGCEK